MTTNRSAGGVNDKDKSPTLQELLRIAYAAPNDGDVFKNALSKATTKLRFISRGTVTIHWTEIRNRLKLMGLVSGDLHYAIREATVIGVGESTRPHYMKAVIIADTINPEVPFVRLELIPSEGEIKFCEVYRGKDI